MRLAILLAAVALIGAAGTAVADKATRQEQAACRPDVRRLCGHIGRGDAEQYRECLQTHFSELSQKCQQVLMKHQNQQ
jgi:DNA-binding FadR family transcriptional regulator